jgi:hypothetical protein
MKFLSNTSKVMQNLDWVVDSHLRGPGCHVLLSVICLASPNLRRPSEQYYHMTQQLEVIYHLEGNKDNDALWRQIQSLDNFFWGTRNNEKPLASVYPLRLLIISIYMKSCMNKSQFLLCLTDPFLSFSHIWKYFSLKYFATYSLINRILNNFCHFSINYMIHLLNTIMGRYVYNFICIK